jgi:hypothetical protein
LRSDYARRQAMIELDVLTTMALGFDLELLKSLYKILFPVLKQYENDTWYDSKGRVVFSAKSMGELTYKRNEWERNIKTLSPGEKCTRVILDDTTPDGPSERIIEYVAPFDRCDREKDYETAWKFFEKKYMCGE